MKFSVVGVSYQNDLNEVVGDEVLVVCSDWLSGLELKEWNKALAKCCKKLIPHELRKYFIIQCHAFCDLTELKACIVSIRRSLDTFWQLRYEFNQSVPPSFVPDSSDE